MSASLESRAAGSVDNRRLVSLDSTSLWHSSAPATVRSAWQKDPQGQAWRAWVELLQGRGLPKAIRDGGKKAVHPLEWGADSSLAEWLTWRSDLRTTITAAETLRLEAAIETWVDQADHRPADAAFALECLSWAEKLPTLAGLLESDAWWRLLDHLHEVALAALDVSLGDDPPADKVFAHQIIAAEMPLVLTRLMPELLPLRQLRKPAAKSLTEGVLALTDGEGMPTGRAVDYWPLLFACWTRCRAWAEKGKPVWSDAAETQYEWLVRQMLCIARKDGTLALGQSTLGAQAVFAAAMGMAADKSDWAAAAKRFGGKAYTQAAGKSSPPEPSVNSEWSCVSVLASGWNGKSHRAVVTYEGAASRLEYSAANKTVISGAWSTEVRLDGELLQPVDEWEEQCWYSDDDCDFLEISLDLEQGVKLARQVVVTRDDKVAYLADMVLTSENDPRDIAVTMRLPLPQGGAFLPEEETREGWLAMDGAPAVGIVPAALPEWRTDPRQYGELTEEAGELVLRQKTTGRNLCCPLFLDASASRFKKQHTWRQLAVAERLENVSPDVAVAYRYQSGKNQWVVYRSLQPRSNRTFIGHNLSSECLFGRFLNTGEVDEFFEIEDG